MLKHTLFAALAISAVLAFTASAHAAYLDTGASNTSNATTTLKGTTAGPELLVQNANGSSTSADGLDGLLTAAAPTKASAAIRGNNAATNGIGWGVFGSHAGSGTGVYGTSLRGIGVWGRHAATTGNSPAVRGDSASAAANAYAVYGLMTATSPPGANAAVRGENDAKASYGYGVWGSQAGIGTGVYGSSGGTGVAGSGFVGVEGTDTVGTGDGVFGSSPTGYGVEAQSGGTGVYSSGSAVGVQGVSDTGIGLDGSSSNNDAVYGETSTGTGVHGNSLSSGVGVAGGSDSSDGVEGGSLSGVGVSGASDSNFGVEGYSTATDGVHGGSYSGDAVAGTTRLGDGVYGDTTGNCNGGTNPPCYAAYFVGDVNVNGTLTAATKKFQIDDPLDPAHKYLDHTSVESSDMMDIYDGNVTTDAHGYASVRLPHWFQALNRSFRYQLTVIDKAHWTARAAVWDKIAHNRFSIRTDQAHVQVSWQVTGIRHDPYANAHRTRVVVEKPKADRGKYVNPQVYGKPRSDGIGYRKPTHIPRNPAVKR